jgi:preprotein translocase subunit SecG
LIIAIALIGVILVQRSEGGGLGMGTAGNNGLVSVRGTANLLTRTTAILATLFFATAIGLTVVAEIDRGSQSILQRAADGVGDGAGNVTVLDALNALQPDSGLAIPQTPTPAPEAPANDTAPATDQGLAVPAAPADSGAQAPAADSQPADTAPAAPGN